MDLDRRLKNAPKRVTPKRQFRLSDETFDKLTRLAETCKGNRSMVVRNLIHLAEPEDLL